MSPTIPKTGRDVDPKWIRVVREGGDSLYYGVVQLIVHDGRVMQVERTEKTRFAQRDASQQVPQQGRACLGEFPPRRIQRGAGEHTAATAVIALDESAVITRVQVLF